MSTALKNARESALAVLLGSDLVQKEIERAEKTNLTARASLIAQLQVKIKSREKLASDPRVARLDALRDLIPAREKELEQLEGERHGLWVDLDNERQRALLEIRELRVMLVKAAPLAVRTLAEKIAERRQTLHGNSPRTSNPNSPSEKMHSKLDAMMSRLEPYLNGDIADIDEKVLSELRGELLASEGWVG